MINHVRSLLLNKLAADATFPGEEYVIPNYAIRYEPQVVQKIKQIVFGGDPDRYMLNYRLYQIMVAIHATELVEYVSYHDTRLTYLPFRATALYNSAYQNAATLISSTDATIADLAFVGELIPEELAGWLHYRWTVNLKNWTTSTGELDIARTIPTAMTATNIVAITDKRSDTVTLPGSSLQFNVSGTLDDNWVIDAVARPRKNIGTILATLDSGLTEIDSHALFGVAPTEPLLTFKNLWHSHDEYAYRFGALMLAVAWLMHEQVAV